MILQRINANQNMGTDESTLCTAIKYNTCFHLGKLCLKFIKLCTDVVRLGEPLWNNVNATL